MKALNRFSQIEVNRYEQRMPILQMFLNEKRLKKHTPTKDTFLKLNREFCNSCDEGILNGTDLKATEKQIRDFQANIDGLLTSTEIRKVREKLKLSQEQAAEICGDDPKTFCRYERGEATPQRAISNLLTILNNHPELLPELTR